MTVTLCIPRPPAHTAPDLISGGGGKRHRQACLRQSAAYRVQGTGGCIILIAEMGQQNGPGTGPGAFHRVHGGGIIAQVALLAQNPLLQGVGIGAGTEHFHVMIALQHQNIRPQQAFPGLVGDVSGVRQISYPALRRVKTPCGALPAVMAGGQDHRLHLAEQDGLAQLHRPQ